MEDSQTQVHALPHTHIRQIYSFEYSKTEKYRFKFQSQIHILF